MASLFSATVHTGQCRLQWLQSDFPPQNSQPDGHHRPPIPHHDVEPSLYFSRMPLQATFSDLVSNIVTTTQGRNRPQERCYPNLHVAASRLDTLARTSDKRRNALGDALVGLLTSPDAIADKGSIAGEPRGFLRGYYRGQSSPCAGGSLCEFEPKRLQ